MIDKQHSGDDNNSPAKAYHEELENKGSAFGDTSEESDARDQAKIEKARVSPSQKMDGGNPHADDDTVSDDEIARESIEKK